MVGVDDAEVNSRLILFCLPLSSPYNPKFDAPIVASFGAIISSSTMGLLLLTRIIRKLWKEWELRLLILLSLSLQLTLACLGRKRRSIYNSWIQYVVWTTYLLAEAVASLSLGVLSNRLANIKEMKGTFDPRSQITALWAPFLLLHLGGPDTITAFALADNELWLRQLARLCVQVGLTSYIYFMALVGSPLSILAEGMILVGFIKYAERVLCLFLASNGRLRDSMQPIPSLSPIYSRIVEQFSLKKEEGYRVRIDEVKEIWAPGDLPMSSGQPYAEDKAANLVTAYKLFETFKLLFVGLILKSGDLAASRRLFMLNEDSQRAFGIVEIELGFMYDLLYTKVPLLNCAWGIVRWGISIAVPGAVLVLFSLQDKKDYPRVDIYITFFLVCLTILAEIYSLLLAVSSDWVVHWRLQRPRRSIISPANGFLQVGQNRRWGNSVAQFCLLRLSIGIGNRIFHKCPMLANLKQKAEKNFYVGYKEFKSDAKHWIFFRLREQGWRGMASHKKEVTELLSKLNLGEIIWSVEEMEFDQSILIWHIATELCYFEDHGVMEGVSPEYKTNFKMSKLVSRYMLYLLIFHPSMLPSVIGVVRYEDTLVDAQKFFEEKKVTADDSCNKAHKSRKSRELCRVYHRLLHDMNTDLPMQKMRRGTSKSVLFDACRLASQLRQVDGRWDVFGEVWATMLICSAHESKGHKHCESLTRGGELLSHVWLLLAHLGMVAQPEQPNEPDQIIKLIAD